MANGDSHRLAVLIDADNASSKMLKALLEEVRYCHSQEGLW